MAKDYSNIEGLIGNVKESIRNAYDKGYKQGFKEGNYNKEFFCNLNFEHGTNKGLDDAWECVKKLAYEKTEGGLDIKDLKKIFDGNILTTEILQNYSASEAVKRVKAWEEKQKQAGDEIIVGDEVIDGKVFNSGKGIVTFVSPIVTYVLWYDGSTGRRKLEDIKKTGRHFDKIAEVLEQLKEGQDETK